MDFTPDEIEWGNQFNQLMRETLQDLRTMPYRDYLETDHWKRIRRKRVDIAEHRCEKCGSVNNLNVHHLSYEHRGMEDLFPQDLIVLCKKCHAKEHGK